MPVKEYKAEKMFYTMGEVTEMFDVRASLVRFWTERFDVLKPKKNRKGNRLFSPEDLRNLETIYHLTREKGMTLAGVDKFLKTNRSDAERDSELARRLQTVRSLLIEIREELKEGEDDESEILIDTPDPDEFAEQVLPGEIGEHYLPGVGKFIGEELPEQMPPEEMLSGQTPPEEILSEQARYEPTLSDREEDLFDAEISEPFTAQPLFDSGPEDGTTLSDNPEHSEDQQDPCPASIDTQQSLF